MIIIIIEKYKARKSKVVFKENVIDFGRNELQRKNIFEIDSIMKLNVFLKKVTSFHGLRKLLTVYRFKSKKIWCYKWMSKSFSIIFFCV